MPTARTAMVSVATYAWLSFTLKSRAELLVFYKCHLCMALTKGNLNHGCDRNFYCLWTTCHWWSEHIQTRSKLPCVLQLPQLSPLWQYHIYSNKRHDQSSSNPPLINFGVIQFSTIPGIKLLITVVPISLFCDNKGLSKTISRRNSYPINVLLWHL